MLLERTHAAPQEGGSAIEPPERFHISRTANQYPVRVPAGRYQFHEARMGSANNFVCLSHDHVAIDAKKPFVLALNRPALRAVIEQEGWTLHINRLLVAKGMLEYKMLRLMHKRGVRPPRVELLDARDRKTVLAEGNLEYG